MEIIEIGAVAVRDNGPEILDEYCGFIRPVLHSRLTPFCTELTTITQDMVDSGELFADAIARFASWLDDFDDPIFCSWGYYDFNQLTEECKRNKMPYPFDDHHQNIKSTFLYKHNITKGRGLESALRHAGMELEGTLHRGVIDARNMARLGPFIFGNQPIPGGA